MNRQVDKQTDVATNRRRIGVTVQSFVRHNLKLITFELQDDDDANGDDEAPTLSRSTTSFVERGIRRMLEGVDIDVDVDNNAGVDKVREEFSTEVRAYIASHFRCQSY
jgi:hypothetical protein